MLRAVVGDPAARVGAQILTQQLQGFQTVYDNLNRDGDIFYAKMKHLCPKHQKYIHTASKMNAKGLLEVFKLIQGLAPYLCIFKFFVQPFKKNT